ncbi:MAG: NHL repeat containing [Actinobacteria bacterium]|nr:MAG: NHL repeat containing [Actinomycetota bacterium]
MTESSRRLSNYLAERERSGRAKKIIALALLALLLLLLVWMTLNYLQNGRVVIPFITTTTEAVVPPEYLYSIAGPEGADALTQPIGVAVSASDRVYIVDNKSATVRCYDVDGRYRFSFKTINDGANKALVQPARVAEGPGGEIWVTDRRLRSIYIFDRDGAFKRKFAPEGDAPEDWAPIWVSFDAQGNTYVCDIGLTSEHQVIVYDSSGVEVARFGKTVQAKRMLEAPGGFYYPNGVAVAKNGDIFVSDSNNRRVQVFDKAGAFKYIISTSGTPRGVVIDKEQRLYVVDAFAHTIDIYNLQGKRIAGFGGNGVELGKFQYPTDIAIDKRGRLFISDRENNQVQVWGWPTTTLIPPIEVPKTPMQWVICLSPLLLFLLPLLRRKRSFVVTSDFVEGMALAEMIHLMVDRRFKWLVPAAEMDSYEGRILEGVKLGDLLAGTAHSESDVVELIEKTGITRPTAILLTMSQRAGRLATEDSDLRRSAQSMGVEVFDRMTFVDTFGGRAASTKDAG